MGAGEIFGLILLVVGLVVIGYAIYFTFLYWYITFPLFVIVAIGTYQYKKQKKEEEQRRTAEEEARRKQEEYEANQVAISKRLSTVVTNSIAIFQDMPKYVTSAEDDIKTAESEFKERAFAPFWDAVERAATKLANFDSNTRHIIHLSSEYNKERGKLDSTPPSFSIDINKIPDAKRIANRMQNIVRCAQRDFQFATIYEQRKTNKLLVTGFTSLGQALSEMSSRIENSLNALSSSISDFTITNQGSLNRLIDGVESLREESISHNERELEILDNIQRRKKP